jgi:hypothetical protein
MILAENIYKAFKDRAKSTNWADWVAQNETMSKLLIEAEDLCHS